MGLVICLAVWMVPQLWSPTTTHSLYLHCASHSLNLAIVKSLDETSVRNMTGVMNSFNSKRQRKLEEAIDWTQAGSAVKKLKDLCHTRWVERSAALDQFKKLHSSLASCFETISAEGSSCWTPDSLTDASILLLAISTTDFLSALVITSSSLSYLMALTVSSQKPRILLKLCLKLITSHLFFKT